jgi:glycosyltransferase involved in cell wall biosynthesis
VDPDMSRLIYVPLEHIDGRYTIHMDRDIEQYLQNNNIDYVKIMPNVEPGPLPTGMFLNAAFTTKFKSLQLAAIAEMYEKNEITDDDVFFFSDIWFPGIESLAYMNYFWKVNPKITGIIHAGSFTDTDFVRDMERWAKNFEDIVFDIADVIYCASEFIRQDILKKRMVPDYKLVVSGLPVDFTGLEPYRNQKKERIIIFNGRLCDEKQPWLAEQLLSAVKQRIENDDRFTSYDKNFHHTCLIKTQENNFSKDEYYKLLGRACVVVSFALQENFGFGIAEAAYLGCVPVVPNRLVYPELYDKKYLYNNFDEAVEMTVNALLNYEPPDIKIENNCFDVWFKENI